MFVVISAIIYTALVYSGQKSGVKYVNESMHGWLKITKLASTASAVCFAYVAAVITITGAQRRRMKKSECDAER